MEDAIYVIIRNEWIRTRAISLPLKTDGMMRDDFSRNVFPARKTIHFFLGWFAFLRSNHKGLLVTTAKEVCKSGKHIRLPAILGNYNPYG
jgi:hypothetical protein